MSEKRNPMKRAFDFFDEVIKNPDAYPDSFVAIPRDPDLIAKLLSRERTKILDYLEKNGPLESLQMLADALGRDKGAVSRDVGSLAAVGLVNVSKNGRRKRLNATRRPILVV